MQYAYALNLSICIGCRKCAEACHVENNHDRPTNESYIRVFEMQKGGIDFAKGNCHYDHPVPVALTCGAEEENIHNNRLMAEALARQGYPVDFNENPDMHNYTGWRDCFDPHLTDLLEVLWA